MEFITRKQCLENLIRFYEDKILEYCIAHESANLPKDILDVRGRMLPDLLNKVSTDIESNTKNGESYIVFDFYIYFRKEYDLKNLSNVFVGNINEYLKYYFLLNYSHFNVDVDVIDISVKKTTLTVCIV